MSPHPPLLQVLLNAEVYAPSARGHCNLVIAAGKVLWVGSKDLVLPAFAVPPPAAPPRAAPPRAAQSAAAQSGALEVVAYDLHGARLIPGLVDGHAHFTGGGGEAGFATRVPPLALDTFLKAGITSAIGVLGTDDLARSTAELLATTRGLADCGFGAWCLSGGYHYPPTTLCGSVRADLAFLDRVLGVGEFALSDHRSSQPTLAELLRLASETHVGAMMSGKAGVLHLHLGDGERGLDLVFQALAESELPPSMFQPTHVNRRSALFEQALELARRGCPIDVTAFPVADGEDALSAEDALEAFLETGLPAHLLSVSSDGGGCLPSFDADGRVESFDVARPAALTACLRTLLQRGHALESVLPFFSTHAATTWRLPGKGAIRAGADADLVLLDADHRSRAVMLGGAWHAAGGCVPEATEFPSALTSKN